MYSSTLLLTMIVAATAAPVTLAYHPTQCVHHYTCILRTPDTSVDSERRSGNDIFARGAGKHGSVKESKGGHGNGGNYHPPRPAPVERPFYHGDRERRALEAVSQMGLQERSDREAIQLFARSVAEALLDALD